MIMHMILKGLKVLFFNPYRFVQKNNNIIVGKDTVLMKRIDFRVYPENKIVIGNLCMLSNSFIFESNQGQIEIGDRTFIHVDTKIISREKISIGNDVMISWGCTLYDHNSHSLDYRERIKDFKRTLFDYHQGRDLLKSKDWSVVKSNEIIIGDNVWIGFGCTILKGVKIGTGAVIGAQSVVREDVDEWTVVAGNPAKVVKKLKPLSEKT